VLFKDTLFHHWTQEIVELLTKQLPTIAGIYFREILVPAAPTRIRNLNGLNYYAPGFNQVHIQNYIMKQAHIIIARWFMFLLAIVSCNVIAAQQPDATHNYATIKEAEWVIPKNDTLDYAFDNYDSSKALLLKRNIMDSKSASIAYPKNLRFKDGTIEADLASPGGGAGYIGLAFRIKDAHHYETIYFRPGYSRTFEALQYMPELKQEFNWWGYNDRTHQARAIIPKTGWFHVKLEVKGTTMTVFINNVPEPVFVYKELDETLDMGSVGFWLGNSAVGAYKNLMVKTF
jgi:hypothetical protein